MDTGAKTNSGKGYAAPFQHQGTGTINILVLSLLSLIAELKQNVIFAMEEPEIALPPHIQKRIIDNICKKSAQALFTSHSPFVLEEFKPSQVLVLRRNDGILSGTAADYPPSVKPKTYRAEFRSRFCEAILSKMVLITEGRTEYDAYPSAARRLHEIDPIRFKTLEALGLAVINANSHSQIAPIGKYFANLGKLVFAVYDKHSDSLKADIETVIPHSYEAPEKGFEDVVLNGVQESALRRYALGLVAEDQWPKHLKDSIPTETMAFEDLRNTLKDYLSGTKGAGAAADILGLCSIAEMPVSVVSTLEAIQLVIEPPNESNVDQNTGKESEPTIEKPSSPV